MPSITSIVTEVASIATLIEDSFLVELEAVNDIGSIVVEEVTATLENLNSGTTITLLYEEYA